MDDDRGFSLVEAVVAMALVVAVAGSIATALLTGRAIAARERDEAIGRAAAQARLATLTSLAFGSRVDPSGVRIAETDTTTDVTADPPAPGGAGLSVSPTDALWVDRVCCVDYLDAAGAALGRGTPARDRAAYVRRWAIGRQGSPGAVDEVATLAVLVAPIAAAARAAAADPRRLAAEPGVILRRTARLRQAS